MEINCTQTVDDIQLNDWRNRILADQISIVLRIFTKLCQFASFWKNTESFKDIRNAYIITKLKTEIPYSTGHVVCDVCNSII